MCKNKKLLLSLGLVFSLLAILFIYEKFFTLESKLKQHGYEITYFEGSAPFMDASIHSISKSTCEHHIYDNCVKVLVSNIFSFVYNRDFVVFSYFLEKNGEYTEESYKDFAKLCSRKIYFGYFNLNSGEISIDLSYEQLKLSKSISNALVSKISIKPTVCNKVALRLGGKF